jgi:hypothetical protein
MRLTLTTRRPPAVAIAVSAGLLLGVLSVAGVGLAAGTGVLAGEPDESKAVRVLRHDQLALARLQREVSDDLNLADLHASAQAADRLAVLARQRDTTLAVLDDKQVKADATRAHSAIVTILAGYANLADVTDADLDAWDNDERDIVSAFGELDAAVAPVAAMNPERPLRLNAAATETLTEKTSAYFTYSARKLAGYEKRMVKFRRKNRARIQQLANYRTTVQAQLAAYQATRKELQSYIDDATEFDDRIVDFRAALRDAKSRRAGIRSTLAALNPADELQSEHQRIVAVLDHAVSATDVGIDLANATEDLRDSGDYYTSGFELPEYDDFVRQSDQITAERDAAIGNWTRSLNRYESRLKNPKGAPKRPVI